MLGKGGQRKKFESSRLVLHAWRLAKQEAHRKPGIACRRSALALRHRGHVAVADVGFPFGNSPDRADMTMALRRWLRDAGTSVHSSMRTTTLHVKAPGKHRCFTATCLETAGNHAHTTHPRSIYALMSLSSMSKPSRHDLLDSKRR